MDDSPGAQKTRNGVVLRATWPLTGLDAHDAAPTHPPLVVKFDNTHSSRPQIGLRKADMVTEELVEGGQRAAGRSRLLHGANDDGAPAMSRGPRHRAGRRPGQGRGVRGI